MFLSNALRLKGDYDAPPKTPSSAMLIWIFQTGEPLHCDEGNPRPMRAMNLANKLCSMGHQVVLFTSDFYHQKKKQRGFAFGFVDISPSLRIQFIPSPGYRKNIGIGRLWDHFVIGYNLFRVLRDGLYQKPDVAFVGYPPIEWAAVAIRWLNLSGVPSMLDVKDLWPSIFLEPFPEWLHPLIKVCLFPYFLISRYTLRNATAFSSMSQPYLNWMAEYAHRSLTSKDIVAPLTAPINVYSEDQLLEAEAWWRDQGILWDDTPVVSFVGSFMSVFDFGLVRDAAHQLEQDGVRCLFVLAGDGGFVDDAKTTMAGCSNVVFPGWIDGPKINVLYKHSKCALIPYKDIENYTLNTPNKVIDALSNGVPIVTSLTGEVERLVHEYGIGYACNMSTGLSFYDAIRSLIENHQVWESMSSNCLSVYSEKFSFDSVYGVLADKLAQLGEGRNDVNRSPTDE